MRFSMPIAGLLALGCILAAALSAEKPKKQFLNPPGSTSAAHGYTAVVTSAPGRMIFVSGQQGTGADGKFPADFPSQATNAFENMKKCLTMAGASFNDIVKVNYFLTDMNNVGELRRIRARYLNQTTPPASTLVQAGLGNAPLLEVEAIAVIPE